MANNQPDPNVIPPLDPQQTVQQIAAATQGGIANQPTPTPPFSTLPSPGAVQYRMPPIPPMEQSAERRSIRDIVGGIGFHDVPGTETPAPNQPIASSIGIPTIDRMGRIRPPLVQPDQPIPSDLMHAAGRAAYEQMRPQVTAPAGSSEANRQRQEQILFDREHHFGADISQMPGTAGKILHGLSIAGNIAGDVLRPQAMVAIPGTQLHQAAELRNLQEEEPRIAAAETEQAKIPIEQEEAQTEAAKAQIEKQKYEEGETVSTEQGMFTRGPQGLQPMMYNGQQLDPKQAAGNYQTQAFQDLKREGMSTQEALGVMAAAQNASKNDPARDQAMKSYMQTHPRANQFQAYMATQPPPQALVYEPTATGDLAPTTVRGGGPPLPAGTIPATQFGKVGQAEQNRADYAENLNENLSKLEDIVNRRPELFGPVHGRITQVEAMVGSDDPDVTTLRNIKDNIGVVNQSVHGMRNAYRVEGASNAVLHWGDSPDGVRAAIKSARDSAATFSRDVQQIRQTGTAQPRQGAAPTGGGETGGGGRRVIDLTK